MIQNDVHRLGYCLFVCVQKFYFFTIFCNFNYSQHIFYSNIILINFNENFQLVLSTSKRYIILEERFRGQDLRLLMWEEKWYNIGSKTTTVYQCFLLGQGARFDALCARPSQGLNLKTTQADPIKVLSAYESIIWTQISIILKSK